MRYAAATIFLISSAACFSQTRGFEANAGQTDSRVQFVFRGERFSLFLTSQEAVLAFARRDSSSSPLRLQFAGSRDTRPTGEDLLPAHTSYFLGREGRWLSSVPVYNRVRYQSLYPKIDLLYHSGADGLEYDFLVNPGGNPEKIHLHFPGISAMSIDEEGSLVLSLGAGDIRQHRPVAYQDIGGKRVPVLASYRISDKNEVSIEIGRYDRRRALVIDPVLSYSSYLGGSASSAGMSVAVDASGNTYIAGVTAALDFPGKNELQPALKGDTDAFVTKINPAGTELIYSTYLGGSGQDMAYGIAVDGKGQAYLAGSTTSTDFPTKNAFQSSKAGKRNGFVSVLSADGQSLVYSSYLGGSGDDSAYAIAVSSQGQATVAGAAGSNDFPVLNAYQAAHAGGIKDGFITQLNPAGQIVFSTYLGGSAGDECHGVALDGQGNIYLTGATWSSDFPAPGTLQPFQSGLYSHAFVTELNASGSGLIYSTFLGGSGQDIGNAIAVDDHGAAYVTGETSSTDFPVVGGQQAAIGEIGGEDAFVAKISPGGTAVLYSSYLGGDGDDFAAGVALTPTGNMLIAGGTASTDFPLSGSLVPSQGGLSSAFVTSMPPSGPPAFSTLLGGSFGDAASAVAADGNGNTFVTGWTNSKDFPIFEGVQRVSQGLGDVFLAKLSAPASSSALASVSAASYVPMLAPSAIASGFGSNIASSTAVATSLPLPLSLNGVSVQVVDSQGVQRPAPLFAVSTGQVNYFVPDGTAPGFANVTVTRTDGSTLTGSVNVSMVAPALFAANENGQGVAAAIAVAVTGSNQTSFPVFSGGASGSRTPVPIDLGSGNTQVYLQLYGSGIRNRSSLSDIQIHLGSQSVPALYAGTTQFAGLDQINFLIPKSLRGSGNLPITVVIDGKISNSVLINIL